MYIPVIIEENKQDESVFHLQLEIKEDLPFFRGHFPHLPIVPGAFQIQWVIDQSLRLQLLSTAQIKIKSAKFKTVMPPNIKLWLELIKKMPNEITFMFYLNDQVFSKGTLCI